MKRIIFAIILAVIVFALLNFIYCNLDSETLNYPIRFKFIIPYILSVESVPVPAGFAMIAAFSLGIVAFAFLQAIPALMKSMVLRSKNKKIKELEKRLESALPPSPSSSPLEGEE